MKSDKLNTPISDAAHYFSQKDHPNTNVESFGFRHVDPRSKLFDHVLNEKNKIAKEKKFFYY